MYKNDSVRVRERYDGKVLVFTMSQEKIFDQVRCNLKIPFKVVQDELQRDLELKVSMSKAFRAKAKAKREIRGDHVLQYSRLRDSVVELQSTNSNTIVKIIVKKNIDPSLPTRVFQRIYVCLGALKLGFRACIRELLGLDGAFMKGSFLGQVLVAVGLDLNNGIYPLDYALVKAKSGNNAEASSSASRQVQAELAIGQDGSGRSCVCIVIGLPVVDCAGGACIGVGSHGSSHTRWIKRKTLRIPPHLPEYQLFYGAWPIEQYQQDLGLGGGGCLREYVRVVAGTDGGGYELLIPTSWSDESKNEKRAKDKGTEVIKDKVSQEHVCKEAVPLNNNIWKQSGDLVEMPSEAMKQGMENHLPDEIDGAKGEQVPNHVVKKGNLEILVCKQVANHGGGELVDKERPLKKKNFVMSDSEDSTVTYTERTLSGGLSSGPPSPDYVPGPEHPHSPVYVPYVPEPAYPEFDVLLAEEQPLPAVFDPEEDPEEDDEDPEVDPADYPNNRDYDDDEEEEESFGDDADDEEEDEDEEEEEHLALADSVDRFLAIFTPPPSPLTSYSSPLPQIPSVSPPLPIPSLPLPASPTHPLGYRAAMIRLRVESPSTSHPLPPPPIVLSHTRASMAMMRVAAQSTYILASRSGTPSSGTPPHLPIPLPTSSPPLLLPSTDCRADVPEVMLPPWKRLCIAPGPRFEVGECSSAPTARPTEVLGQIMGTPAATDVARLSQRMTYFVMIVRQDTDEIYGRLDDAHDDRSLMSGQLNMLHRDRHAHARTAKLMETEARLSCEAWVQSMDASDTARSKTQMAMLQSQQTPARDTAHLDALIDQGVADALASRDADRSWNDKDNHNSGTGGTEGVIELTQWFERMEIVFRISNCTMENQIKFSTCTLLGSDLTWWNSHVRTVCHDMAYAMTWTNLKKKMTDKYCSRGKIKKLEVEMWNLKVQGTDVVSYNQHFQELALICTRMFLEESDKIEKYVGGLPDMIHKSIKASKQKTMQDAIEFAIELMDKKIRTFAER
ncbi:putative reverse transcriptase domain-containing protein [Tanacetum coccineum]